MQQFMDYVSLGTRIRKARQAAQMTQERLGEACDLSTAHIGHIERGTRIPSLETLYRISIALHVSLDYLVFDSAPNDLYILKSISTMLQGKSKTKARCFHLAFSIALPKGSRRYC